jgi:hypothetical protein
MPYSGIDSINTLDENKFENHFVVCGSDFIYNLFFI